MAICKSCNAEIAWVKSAGGKMMPVDKNRVTVITPEGNLITGGLSHFATCPNAAQHRKPKPEKSKLRLELEEAGRWGSTLDVKVCWACGRTPEACEDANRDGPTCSGWAARHALKVMA
jgi:hypothetical protein